MELRGLNNKIAVVTGSRRGIGRSIALKLAQAGSNVAICDRIIDDGNLEKLADEIKGYGRESLACQVDISIKTQVEEFFNLTLVRFGKIDILVNCAGIWIPGETLVKCSEENWDKVIDTNLKGTFLCCQQAGRIMAEQRSGNIINLSSQVGFNPAIGAGAYSISKAGIIMLTKQMALELSSFNVRVNAIAPGIVKTDFNINIWRDSDTARKVAQVVPLGRLAEPEDIAEIALFLASDNSAYITGAIINVDGGWQASYHPPQKSD